MKKGSTKRLLSVLLVLAMLMAYALPAMAGAVTQIEKVEGLHSLLTKKDPVSSQDKESLYESNDIVRVSIVLADKSTVEKGFSTKNIGENAAAMKYRADLQAKQDSLAQKISSTLGEKLDVVWNLTLAANMISANVKFGQIKAIRAIPGVKSVILETEYEPQEVETSDKPNMAISTGMTGASAAWTAGFTGAGSRVAIIDTGLDTGHQSFDNGAFLHALEEEADEAGMTLEAYMAKKELLNAGKISGVLTKLNAYKRMSGLTADDLFLTDKIPFAFNYVDKSLDVTHMNDTEGEHGSHVAGIAAANRYIPTTGGYLDALGAVNVAGNAPDAQILVMKVFGQNGGAYDSDYMVAIEDAIVLNCDAVNLSLGSAYAGFTESMAPEYQKILNNLETTDTVVVISAGNNYAFGQYAHNAIWQAQVDEFLYNDDVNFHTGGSPGTYANALTVASVDNQGMVDYCFTVAGKNYLFADNTVLTQYDFPNKPFSSLGGQTLDYIFIEGYGGTEDDYAGMEVKDKVVFVPRGGEVNFTTKVDVAANLGAKAVVICNSDDSLFYFSTEACTTETPVVLVRKTDGDTIKNDSAPQTTGDGLTYYTGSITIPRVGSVGVAPQPSDYYTMSDFSSWGVPGNLTLKPEITAPGGNIYSVNGSAKAPNGTPTGGINQYEQMSGTSMAAPQVTGMMAVLMQYIKEKNLHRTDMTDRALAQSLLMSTAKPMIGKDEETGATWMYPVLQQGAGLANVTSAMGAASYVTVDGQSDGKVKVELGDDPEMKGIYTFSYNLTNLNGQPQTYSMDADVFTQALTTNRLGYAYMGRTTAPLEKATVSYTVDGTSVTEVTVPAYASKKITVTIDITEDAGTLNTAFPNGFYVEAFVYANAKANAEGTITSSHSIPVLGFYGNWSAASMFDKGTATQPDERLPYFYDKNGDTGNSVIVSMEDGEYYFGGNPYVDEIYVEDRNALNNLNSFLSTVNYALIRNAGAGKLTITNATTGDVYYEAPVGEGEDWPLRLAGFLRSTNENPCNQEYTQWELPLNWAGTDKSGNPLPEGTTVELKLTMAPEYYVNDDGSVAWDKLGKGASLSIKFTIDNTAPTLVDGEEKDGIVKLTGDVSTLTVHDNQYVALVALYDAEGNLIDYINPEQDTPNENYTWNLGEPLATGVYQLDVADYAGNETSYRLFVNIDEADKPEDVQSVTVLPETAEVFPGGTAQLFAEVLPYNLTDRTVTWSSSDETIATVDENGVVTAHKPGECTITATSNQNPEIKGSCTFTVMPAPYILYGALQDFEGYPMTFTWDLNSGEGWQKVADIDVSVGSIALSSDGKYYLQDADMMNHKIDPETGETLQDGSTTLAPYWDMSTSMALKPGGKDVIYSIYGPLLLLADPITDGLYGLLDGSAYFQILYEDVVENVDEVMFIGVAAGMTVNDADYGPSELIWALDNQGTMWLFGFNGAEFYFYNFFTTTLPPLPTMGYGDYIQCSLVQADDGETLFYSYFNGDTNVIYKLELSATRATQFEATELSDAGDGVWPMVLAGAHVHNYTAEVTAPTCTEQGYTVYTCACGDTYTADYTDPTGHSYGEWEQTKAPTCTEKGEQKRTCACGDVQTEEVPALGHSYETTVVAPSCTEEGYTLHKCSVCGDSYKTDATDLVSHSYGEWEQTKAPTCTEKGERKHTCAKCGKVETEEIASLGGHKYVDVVTKPTSTEKGYTTHTCSECGDSYIDSYKDPVEPDNSQTGDSFSALLLALPVLSAMGVAALVIGRKKWLVK